MTAFSLAARSLRHRPGGYVATFLTLLLGATILMTFAALLDTGSSETMTIMASVVGGWGLVIVTFATLSALTLVVRQRDPEITLLRNVGATPAQITRMLLAEAGTLAGVGGGAARTPAVFTSRALVGLFRDSGQVPAGTQAAFGPAAVGIGLGVTVTAACLAACLAPRRAVRAGAKPRSGRARVVVGVVLLLAGVNCGVLAMTVLSASDYALMAVAGNASILCAIGLAVLAPAIIRLSRAVMGRALGRAGAAGYLTALNLHGHRAQLASAVAPIILFTAIATGTLYMQSIENTATSGMRADMAETIETLNYVVVGMIALFAAVMLTNTLIAATLGRRREFGQLRLAGTTPPQVLRMVGIEAAVLAAAGVLFGSLAATATVIPYSVAKTGSLLPDTTITIYLAIIVLAAALTLAASVGTARRTIRPPAIHLVAHA